MPLKIGKYRLSGNQVEPEASFWTRCNTQDEHACDACLVPRPVPIQAVIGRTSTQGSPYYLEGINEVEGRTEADFKELTELEQLRDDPGRVIETMEGRERLPISLFLQLRPPPLGGVITVNTARGEAFPVIQTGRELGRYFENNTPGVAHRQALNFLIRDTGWSPPRQALVWAALDIAIYSALAAAWYFKWLDPRTARRERPHEFAVANKKTLNVFFDCYPNSTGSGDGPMRPDFPRVNAAKYINTSPGTPRHPAYPSGHSTYAGAASELLSFFFPDYRRELDFLADNTGMARMWAGIHWRADHENGLRLGRAVACLLIEQLRTSGIPMIAPPRNDNAVPPTVQQLQTQADAFAGRCGNNESSAVPGFIQKPSVPCEPPGPRPALTPGATRAG